MVIGHNWKKTSIIEIIDAFLRFTFHSFVTETESVNIVFWTFSIKYTVSFKGGTFISDDVVQCLSLLYGFIQINLRSGSPQCRWILFFKKGLKRLIY